MYGGTASPNPSFPQQVVNVGTVKKNLLNIAQNSYTFPTTNTDYQTIGTIDLVANQKYYFSYTIENDTTSNTRNTPGLQLAGGTRVYESSSTNYNLIKGRKVWEYTPSETGTYTVGYWCHSPNVAITIKDFMISTYSSISYIPYGYGGIDIKVQNQNILNVPNQTQISQGITVTVANNIYSITGTNTGSTATMDLKDVNLVLEAGTYTLATNSSNEHYPYMQLRNGSSTIASNEYNDNGVKTFTLTEKTTIDNVRLYFGSANATSLALQIVKGAENKTYVVHEEQTVTLILPSGMEMCKIGNYQDKFVKQNGTWYKNKQIGKVVLDGTDTTTIESNSGTNTFRFRTENNTLMGGTNGYCNNNQFVATGVSSDTQLVGITGGYIYYRINKDIINSMTGSTNKDKFNNWLSINNAILYAPLITPVLEEITDTNLIEQLDNTLNLYSYEGTTYINSDDVISPIFDVEYYKYTEIGNVERQIEELNQNKQDKLVSGTNIKTINNQSVLGSGNITISGGTVNDSYSTSTTEPYSCNYVNGLNGYSTTEQRIGTWIDGKPLYRKVVDCGALPNNAIKSTAHGISNLDKIIYLNGIAYNSTTFLPIQWVEIENKGVQMNADYTNINIITNRNLSNITQTYITLEYTKTTD